MNNSRMTQQNDKIKKIHQLVLKKAAQHDHCIAAISKNKTDFISAEMSDPTTNTATDSFFTEPVEPRQQALAMASEVIRRLLIWMADGRTLEDRGLRACVALYCVRPDLIDGASLDRIGVLAECSRQAVHKLASEFRQTTGLQ